MVKKEERKVEGDRFLYLSWRADDDVHDSFCCRSVTCIGYLISDISWLPGPGHILICL